MLQFRPLKPDSLHPLPFVTIAVVFRSNSSTMTIIAALSKMPTSQAVNLSLGASGVVAFVLSSVQHFRGAFATADC